MLSENKKKLIGKIVRYIGEICLAIAAVFGVTQLTSCASMTQAVIKQSQPNSSVTVTISTNNSTDFNVNPTLKYDKTDK